MIQYLLYAIIAKNSTVNLPHENNDRKSLWLLLITIKINMLIIYQLMSYQFNKKFTRYARLKIIRNCVLAMYMLM